jgi:hypothetical protein
VPLGLGKVIEEALRRDLLERLWAKNDLRQGENSTTSRT